MIKLVFLAEPDLKTKNDTGFYEYRQNNSGGIFVSNHNVSTYVIIEARNATEADSIAQDVGIYFNGCDSGIDCSCCGDRWYPKAIYWGSGSADYETLADVKKAYEKTVIESWMSKDYWVGKGEPYAIVYKLNGDKIVYIKDR